MVAILLERFWEVFSQNRRAYLILNALYYGIMLLTMTYLAFDPNLRDSFNNTYQNRYFQNTPLMLAGQPFAFDPTLKNLTSNFLFNLMGSSYAEISLPSFIIPFVGIVIGLSRAVIFGIAFSPANPTAAGIFLPHLPTLLLDGQAAILAMLGAYIHGRAFIWPKTVGEKSRWKAFIEGVRQSGMMYVPIIAVLLLSAIYGFVEVALLSAR